MQDLKTWEFRNTDTKETVRIMAIDGHNGWLFLAELLGHVRLNGAFCMPMCHPWVIYCVCPCGKASTHAFCSEVCYQEYLQDKADLGLAKLSDATAAVLAQVFKGDI